MQPSTSATSAPQLQDASVDLAPHLWHLIICCEYQLSTCDPGIQARIPRRHGKPASPPAAVSMRRSRRSRCWSKRSSNSVETQPAFAAHAAPASGRAGCASDTAVGVFGAIEAGGVGSNGVTSVRGTAQRCLAAVRCKAEEEGKGAVLMSQVSTADGAAVGPAVGAALGVAVAPARVLWLVKNGSHDSWGQPLP